MEKTIRNLFLTGCLLTGVAVSLTAASSYAATATGANAASTGASMSTTYSLTVNKAITLSSVTGPSITAVSNDVKTGNISATVTSNSGYQLQLSAATPALTGETNKNNTIPAKVPTAGADGWAVQDQTNSNAYKVVTTTPTNYFTRTASAPTGVTTNLVTGVSVSKILAPDTYQTTVTVTAVSQ